jgi:hypothetical protein
MEKLGTGVTNIPVTIRVTSLKECISSTSPVSMMLGEPRKIVLARRLPKKFHP